MQVYARSRVGDKCGAQVLGPTTGQAQNLLPTKTSSFVIHLSGRSPSFIKIASQVARVSLMWVIVLLIIVAVILSSISRLFIGWTSVGGIGFDRSHVGDMIHI